MSPESRRPTTRDIAAATDARDEVPAAQDRRDGAHAPLFVEEDASAYRTRWSAIQTGFVDEPRKAVEEADALVAEVVKRLAEMFSDERGRLEQAWDRDQAVDTEALRQAMRRYRSFFERLLTV